MKKMSSRKIIILTLITLTLFGVLYSIITPNIYSSKSQIAIFRLKIENPDSNSEEGRNRWIWIRDGLNIKSAIISDEIIEKLIATNKDAEQESKHFTSKFLYMQQVKSLINLQFTGADENNYLIEVKSKYPTLALDLNTIIFDRIKFLVTTSEDLKFTKIIEELQKKQSELKNDQATYSYYEDKLRKLIFNHIIEQKQRESAFEVVTKPILNDKPIWPNYILIILTSSFIGLVLGLGISLLYRIDLRNK